MRRKPAYIWAGIGILLCTAILLTGCKQEEGLSGGTRDEPEITVEYLTGEYADQLLRDGAECIFGEIRIENAEDSSLEATVNAKEYVQDSDLPEGYYIADRNLEETYPLSTEARTTYLSSGVSIAKVIPLEDFVNAVQADAQGGGTARLYDVYVIGGQVEMITARYLPQ